MPSSITTKQRQAFQSIGSVGRHSLVMILLVWAILAAGCGDGIGRPIRAIGSSAGSIAMAGDSGGAAGSFGLAAATGSTGPIGTAEPIDAAIAYCSPVLDWPAELVAAEDELLAILNLVRQSGYSCIGGSPVTPAPPLAPAPAISTSWPLRCSARLNSMASFVGESVETRIDNAGFPANHRIVEVTATSEPANLGAAGLLVKLLTSPGTDCANVMDPLFTYVGIGFVAGPVQGYWTIDLASP